MKKTYIIKAGQDLVSFDKVYEMQEMFGMKDKELREVVGLSQSQFKRYENKGKLPTIYYSGMILGVVLAITKRIKNELAIIEKLIDINE